MSRKLTRAEYAFYLNTQEIIERVKQRRRKHHKKNHNWNFQNPSYHIGSRSLLVLVKAGIPYEKAKEILGTL